VVSAINLELNFTKQKYKLAAISILSTKTEGMREGNPITIHLVDYLAKSWHVVNIQNK